MNPVRILILEDNPTDAELAEYTLKTAGINFVSRVVETEREYRHAINEFSPEIIISDYDLPAFTGSDALSIAKELRPDLPFILYTGAMGEERAIQILTGGATDYVMKNRLSRLVPAVERALKESGEHRRRKAAEAERDLLLQQLECRVRERTAQLQEEVSERKRVQEALKFREERVRMKLENILSPAGDIGELDLSDIIDVPSIQLLMDDFYRLADIGMSIIDLDGKILVGVGWQDICTKFHRAHPETCRYCIESDTMLSAGIPPGEFRLYKCRNNMWDIATPLMIGGRHMGNVFSGQFFFEDEPLDYSLFQSQARQYGFDEQDYLSALTAVPRLSREKLNTAMTFFMRLADMISRLSYSNIKLARALSRQDALTAYVNESREDLNRAQAVAKTGSWRLDVRRDKLLWSDETYRIFGIPKDTQMTYEAFLERVHPDDRHYVNRKWTESVKSGEYEIEHRITCGGEVKWVREKAELDFDEKGELLSGFGTVQDITERKWAEDGLLKANVQLQDYARKLEEANKDLESFSFSVSHDLKAPLRAIDGFSRMLLKDTGDKLDAESLRKISVIRNNAEKMIHLIEDLLTLSRTGRTRLSPSRIDMRLQVTEIWEELRAGNPERKMELKLGSIPEASGDKALVWQVLYNLMANAVKFTRTRDLAVIEVNCTSSGEYNTYCVADNGTGFDMVHHDKLFEIFRRLHSASEFEGTGIGLAIVKKIVQKHGGRIWAEGKPGAGAAFFFTLPSGDDGDGPGKFHP